MMLNEKDAKVTICPFTFGVREIRDGMDVGIRESGPWPCIGSRCMVWRWQSELSHGDRRLGYCGLAGRP